MDVKCNKYTIRARAGSKETILRVHQGQGSQQRNNTLGTLGPGQEAKNNSYGTGNSLSLKPALALMYPK